MHVAYLMELLSVLMPIKRLHQTFGVDVYKLSVWLNLKYLFVVSQIICAKDRILIMCTGWHKSYPSVKN